MDRQTDSGNFPVTRWTLITRLREPGTGQATALDEVCRHYWKPLYVHARGLGRSHADAEDQVQAFFATALRRELFQSAEAGRGRLRNLLLTAFKRHLHDHHAHEQTGRRSADGEMLSWDAVAENQTEGPSGTARPDELDAAYDREWARAVVTQSLTVVRAAYEKEKRAALFDGLRPLLLDADDAPVPATVAAELGMKEASLRVALHRLRGRFRDALQDEVLSTISEADALEEELNYLRRCLALPATDSPA